MPFKVIHYDFSLVGSLLYFHAIGFSYSTTLKSVLVHATVNAAGNELSHPVGIEHVFPQCVRTRCVFTSTYRTVYYADNKWKLIPFSFYFRFVTMILFSLQRDFLGSSLAGSFIIDSVSEF